MLSESGEVKPLEPRPFESLKRTDRYYCQYHQSGGHTIENCFKFKDLVKKMINEKKLVQVQQEENTTINEVWDSDEEDVYLKDIVGSPPYVSYTMDDVWTEEDSSIDVLTRSGRIKPPVSTQPMPTTQQVPISIIEDNDIVKQFKKTKVEMNV